MSANSHDATVSWQGTKIQGNVRKLSGNKMPSSSTYQFKGVQPDFRPNFENLGLSNRWH